MYRIEGRMQWCNRERYLAVLKRCPVLDTTTTDLNLPKVCSSAVASLLRFYHFSVPSLCLVGSFSVPLVPSLSLFCPFFVPSLLYSNF